MTVERIRGILSTKVWDVVNFRIDDFRWLNLDLIDSADSTLFVIPTFEHFDDIVLSKVNT